MAVRLSAGLRRGKTHVELRPTSARTLESVFDMLRADVPDTRVLDLYAGVGSYGVMALKNGADVAVFVDKSREAEKRMLRALSQYHFEDRSVVHCEDVQHFLHNAGRFTDPFNIVFADPPYERVVPGELMEQVMESGLLAPQGVFVFEHSKRQAPPDIVGLKLRKSRVFGDTTVSIWDSV
ncbi:MAG: RsmD family RNA methyltransferase [Calditrichaeota bacterium]|nr:RsmD family RNA methyltransferase [Calditrichota bacterium]MCB9391477.1 RsmD family RNA methyltransferase [Calditrichota bacterium]